MLRRKVQLWLSVDQLLDVLECRQRCGKLFDDGFALHSLDGQLIIKVADRAESSHAERLARILLWNEICLNPDIRFVRACLLDALAHIGNSAILPFFEEYREKVKGVAYTDLLKLEKWEEPTVISVAQLHEWDQQEVAQVIATIRERST